MISNTLERIHAGGWVSKSPMDDYWYQPRGIETISGEDIDEDAALTFSTFFTCASFVQDTMATLPIHVFEKRWDAKREEWIGYPVDHELNDLLVSSASDDASGLTVRSAQQLGIDVWGNSFTAVDWNNRHTEVRRLTPLPSREMEVARNEDGELAYIWRPVNGQPEVIPADRMWHVPGMSLNGIVGLSVVAYNRELLGLGAATHKFGSAFFGNGAWAGGFVQRALEAPEMSPEAAERFLASLNEKFRGAGKAFGFGLLREGMEFKQLDMPFEDAMFLGTRKQTRIEVCGLWRIPLILIADDEKSSYHNAEQADVAFTKHCIRPRAVRYEAAAKRYFFRGTRLYLKLNLTAVERGDTATRHEAYEKGRIGGWYSVNDIRRLEDMPPIEGGDEYLVPLNMRAAGDPPPVQTVPAERDDEGRALAIVLPSLRDAIDRIATKECKAITNAFVRRAKEESAEGFVAWLESFYGGHARFVAEVLDPIFLGYEQAAGRSVRPTARDFAEQYADQCYDTVRASLEQPAGVAGLLEHWSESKAPSMVEGLCDLLKGN